VMSFDDRELTALAVDLAAVTGRTHAATRGVFREAAHELKGKWRDNAKETSGTHARRYPYSITWDEKVSTNLEFEIGPETKQNQGFLGPILEFGGVKSPAHLDGQRAADEIIPHLERRIALAAEDLFNA
jgi:hypothetical protein